MATPSVGGDIEDSCNRCGDTWHVVMAKIGDRVVKVVCKLCGGQHNYRNERAPAKAAGTGARRFFRKRPARKTETAGPVVPPFDPSKPPRPYSAADSFQPGERIEHPKFGSGIVSTVPGPGKVEIVFPTGTRVLASAKAGSTLERPTPVTVPIADRPPGTR